MQDDVFKLFSDPVSGVQKTYIIAEMSANHNQNIERAEAIVRAAADAGADAIKMQTYTADTLTFNGSSPTFLVKGTAWSGRTLYDLYQEAYTPWEWQPRLMALANDLGMDCFSTPFDETAVDFLEGLNVPCHKVASFELVDIPLLRKIAGTKKPVIMSTGMGTLAEIDEAVGALRSAGCSELALLKCTSAYPAPPEEANLLTIPHLSQTFGCIAGLSDHTLGSAVAIAAVSLGARIVEKHLTLSRADGGPDSGFSMEPDEFRRMVTDIRTVEKALGCVSYELTEKQKENVAFRRSLFVVEDIRAGEKFTTSNVRSVRPAHGLHPRHYNEILGCQAVCDIPKGTPFAWDMLQR